jgi:hypothetical protein
MSVCEHCVGTNCDICSSYSSFEPTTTQTPRVMKRWAPDCKPEKEGLYWINKEGLLISVDHRTIKSGLFRGHRITHWLEVEPQPILPEDQNSLLDTNNSTPAANNSKNT